MAISDAFTFETKVGEQLYHWQWYHGAMSKSLTMWLVPASIFFSFGFGYAGMNWALPRLAPNIDSLMNDSVFVLSFVTGILCFTCLLIILGTMMFADYKTKQNGISTSFDTGTKQIIEFERDSIQLLCNKSEIILGWASITHIILFNGTVLVGAHSMCLAIPWERFTNIDHLVEFIQYCHRYSASIVKFKNVTFRESQIKDERLDKVFNPA